MFGKHCVKTHSQTEETVAVSSGESDFNGIVKAATMGLCMKGPHGRPGLGGGGTNRHGFEFSKKYRITKGSGESDAH